MATPDVTMWSVEQVSSWLNREGFEEHVDQFASESIDGETLLTLTQEELKNDLGIKQLGKRKRLLKCIDDVRPQIVPQGGQGSEDSLQLRETLADPSADGAPGAPAKRRMVEQAPLSPQHGLVITIEEVNEGDHHYVVLDEKTQRLVRPIQTPPAAPAWPLADADGRGIAVGDRVEYLPSHCSMKESQHPRCPGDIQCARLTRLDASKCKALHEFLAPVASDSLNSSWPNAVIENGCARVCSPSVSFTVVKGSIARLTESPCRADLELGGQVLRGVPVVCTDLVPDPSGQTSRGNADLVNRPGFAILGAVHLYDDSLEMLDSHDDSVEFKLALFGFVVTPSTSRMWCKDETLLANIFQLQGFPLKHKGSYADIHLQMYVDAFVEFLQQATASHTKNTWPCNQEDMKSIDLLIDMFSNASQRISWKPFSGHGCLAVFKHGFQGCYPCPGIASYLIEPASCRAWKRGRSGFTVLAGGRMKLEHMQVLKAPQNSEDTTPQPMISQFHQLLEHQDFWYASQNVEGECFVTVAPTSLRQPCRAVEWSLIKAAIRFVLTNVSNHPRPWEFYKQLVARFCLWLLECQVALVTSANATAARINIALEMLAKVASKAAKVAVNDIHISDVQELDLEERLSKLRAQIEAAALGKAKCDAARYLLPELRDLIADDPSIDMQLMSANETMQQVRNAAAQARKRAAKNVNASHIPLATHSSLAVAAEWLQWLETLDARDRNAAELTVLRFCEGIFFEYANRFDDIALDVQCLEQLIDTYRRVSDRFKSTKAVRIVEQRSRELLVVWIGFCLVDASCCRTHPLLKQYSIALKLDDLKNLALPEKRAVDAALNVHRYIAARNNEASEGEVFSLVDESPTYQLAEKISRSITCIFDLWTAECADAKARVAAHWAEVQRKQALAKHLREVINSLVEERKIVQQELDEVIELERQRDSKKSTISNYTSDLVNTKSRRAETERRLYDYDRDPMGFHLYSRASLEHTLKTHEKEMERHRNLIDECKSELFAIEHNLKQKTPRRQLESKIRKLNQEIQQKQAELKAAEEPPPAVFQPLPSDESSALAILFFLFMPTIFRSLSRISFLAQQMTLPYPWKVQNQWDVLTKAQMKEFSTSWVKYYDQMQLHNKAYHKPAAKRQGTDGAISLHSCLQPPGEDVVRGRHVDDLKDESHGVWYPDILSPRMAWRSNGLQIGSGCLFNPFCKIPSDWKMLFFTENLPEFAKNLQWTMWLPDSISKDRANKAIAFKNNCNERPDWLSKPAFESFVRLRAYPNSQFRKLCVALQQDSLPLTNSAVHVLIRQSLFQLGPITAESKSLWRTDLESLGGLAAISQIIEKVTEEHLQKSRSHEAMLILGELATYFSQWHPALKETLRKLATTCLNWARDLSRREASEEQARSGEMKNKQRLFSIYALLCHAGLDLGVDDARRMCEAMVRVHNARDPNGGSDSPFVKNLLVLCEDAMSRAIGQIMEHAETDFSICTDAIRGALEHVPDNLTWNSYKLKRQAVRLPTACFEAVSRDGHLYTVNLFSGIALLDGYSPTSLPSSIVTHSLYVRTFGSTVFDVTMTSTKRFRTTHAVNGCFYEFGEVGDGSLMVSEFKEGQPGLELQDPSSCCSALPVRLRELHSHWYCPDHGLLLCRPVKFQTRACSYFVILSEGACIQVPEQCKDWDVNRLVESPLQLDNRLVPHHSKATEVLSKFEDPAFIHAFCGRSDRTTNPTISKIELARYRLSFRAEEGKVWSCDYRGYRLAEEQQLFNAFPKFHQYLVLKRDESADPTLPDKRFLMPDASVKKDSDGNVTLSVPSHCGADLGVLQFEVHPRLGYFRAESINCRLQLAGLHVATGTRLPESTGCQLTGVEAAMMLVRQCRSSRPLTAVEKTKLNDVLGLCTAAPGLELLCHDVKLSSEQLGFLHGSSWPVRHGIPHQVVKAYLKEARSSPRNFRRLLKVSEEERILGVRSDRGPSPKVAMLTDLSECPVSADDVQSMEQTLKSHTALPQSSGLGNRMPPFPLSMEGRSSPLEKKAMSDLQASWVAHQKARAQALEVKLDSQDPKVFQNMLQEVVQKKETVHRYLTEALNNLPRGYGFGLAAAERIHRNAYIAPNASIVDMTCMALQPETVCIFNPFLSPVAQGLFMDGIFVFLLLCVLEDKVNRLCSFAKSGNLQQLLRELQVFRIWNVRDHPQWLVFEVEGGLQIRPVQYKVAKFLIDDPSKLVQLNMGEGKTRVIVPMLILYWANTGRVIRLHVLSSLIHEMYDLLHGSLCASLLGRKIIVMPFHRDIQLTKAKLDMMCHVLEECKTDGGVLLVAPEHRLSLFLKQHEERQQKRKDVCKAFEKLMSFPMRDIFDESDEILRHKYQLIYAVGGAVDLPHAAERWNATQAILRVINQDEDVADILGRSGFASREPRGAEAFDVIRLINDTGMQSTIQDFYGAIVSALLKDPPYEFAWLRHYQYEDRVTSFLTKSSWSESELPRDMSEDRKTALLAFRGLLACGVLQHCLERRHHVEYGVNPHGKKRLAVPFRASNTPSERSEYGHPDSAIVFTVLSYYYTGLSKEAVRSSCDKLLQMGNCEQQDIYKSWYSLSRSRIETEDERRVIDAVEKLDLSNELQLNLLHKYYRFNMETINFWLNHCVFPIETKQYPQKLVGNAWHLADNKDGCVHGFSGTNDNQRLLPLQVSQAQVPELAGTNGEMLDLLLRSDEGGCAYNTLHGTADWEEVLKHTLSLNVHALIDCGALTVGANGRQIAEYLLEKTCGQESRHEAFQGVLFFDPNAKQWMILDRTGRCLRKDCSPIQERSCFAYFDEARSRGSDLKLKQDAVALVTVGPKMNKDKLMQAAGRMRMLGRGQTLRFLGTEEVTRKICVNSAIPSVNLLLHWVMRNSITAEEEGLPEWARQGGVFTITRDAQNAALPENLELKDYYAKALKSKTASEIIDGDLNKLLRDKLWRAVNSASSKKFVEDIRRHGATYGTSIDMVASVTDEEYERELEREVQKEQEIIKEVRNVSPAYEEDWRYHSVFTIDNPSRLPIRPMTVQSLTQHVPLLKELGVHWPQQLLCTQNFASTIAAGTDLGGFLRSVDMMLAFPSGDYLLLSDREADAILALFWKELNASIHSVTVHLFSFRLYCAYLSGEIDEPLVLPPSASPAIDSNVVSIIQMFMGDTSYPGQERQHALAEFLGLNAGGQRATVGRRAAMQLLKERGTMMGYERSDLAKLIAVLE